MNDEEIVQLYWARSEAALIQSNNKYGAYCRSIAQNILQSSQDAEECVNDTWLAAWNAIPPTKPDCLRAFLGKLTRNFALTCYRKHQAQKRGGTQVDIALSELEECIPSLEHVEQVVEQVVLSEALGAFLRGLPLEKRRVFVRRYWYLSPIAEIAADYGISQSKTASMLMRMRKQLKSYLEQEGITI